MSNRVGSIERRAEQMLRQNGELKATVKKLEKGDVGRFLVAALAAEREPDLGIVVPTFPISAAEVLASMDSTVDVPNATWKNRCWRYHVPSHRDVFFGVCDAKSVALAEANQIIEAGWINGVGNAFPIARAKVRAGQVLIDWLHFKEGRSKDELSLSATFVASIMITDLCMHDAEVSSVPLIHIKVREAAQLTYEEITENLNGGVEINAFDEVLKLRYRLPHPGSVFMATREMYKVASGEVEPDEKIAVDRWIAGLTEAEKEIYTLSASDIMTDLNGMKENGRTNGHTDVVAKPAPPEAAKQTDPAMEPVVTTDEVVDLDQQAEDEARAAEIDAELRAREAGQDIDPTSDEVAEMCDEQADHMAGLVADATIEPTRDELRIAEQLAIQTEAAACERTPLVDAAPVPHNGKARKPRRATITAA